MNMTVVRSCLAPRVLVPVLCVALVGVSGGWWYRTELLPPRLLKQGEAKLNQGRLRAATEDLERFVEFRPASSHGRMLLSRCLLELGGRTRLEQAVQHLEQIPDEDEFAVEARVKAGDILLLGLGHGSAAEHAYRRAIALDSRNISARQGLFQMYWWQARKTPEQSQWLEDIWQWGSLAERVEVLGRQFWVRYGEVPLDQAFPMMQGFLREDPTDYGARCGFADCLYRVRQYDEAMKICRECSRERPDDPVPRALLVEHALAQGDWATARDFLSSWPESARQSNYWRLRGEYLQQAEGRYAEAIECFERALAERPDRWAWRYRLAQCLDAVGQKERSERERAESDRTGRILKDTRVDYLLKDVWPNIRTRPKGCFEFAQFFEELGLAEPAARWRQIGQELETSPASGQSAGETQATKG